MIVNKYNSSISAKGETALEVKKKLEVSLKNLEVKQTTFYGRIYIVDFQGLPSAAAINLKISVFDSKEKFDLDFFREILNYGEFMSPFFSENNCPHEVKCFIKESKDEIYSFIDEFVDNYKDHIIYANSYPEEVKTELKNSLDEQFSF